jgi:2-polyprenyl-3-methyl-5-hydroxy-6-metoxy-1,4-benzoquinol methylase
MDPARWLVDHQQLLPRVGTALDVACGRGRNAIWLARRGLATLAIDRDTTALDAVGAEADRSGLPLTTAAIDLETDDARLPAMAYQSGVSSRARRASIAGGAAGNSRRP